MTVKTDREILESIEKDTAEIKICLFGARGTDGLIRDFKDCQQHCHAFRDGEFKSFKKEFYSFRLRVLLIGAFVAGTGAVGTGVYYAVQSVLSGMP